MLVARGIMSVVGLFRNASLLDERVRRNVAIWRSDVLQRLVEFDVVFELLSHLECGHSRLVVHLRLS